MAYTGIVVISGCETFFGESETYKVGILVENSKNNDCAKGSRKELWVTVKSKSMDYDYESKASYENLKRRPVLWGMNEDHMRFLLHGEAFQKWFKEAL